jgi:signal transduction histidine kinase/CheY-like chemotaxis protein/HPt (histidine-containing phosphotransfer) domain-containing protein
MQLFRALAVAVLMAWCACADAQSAVAGTARQGVIELPALAPGQVVDLAGEWGFRWQEFTDPDWQALPATEFAPLVGGWNHVRAGGKTAPAREGWASYVARVNCPAGQRYAIAVPNQGTAVRVFVNGTLAGAHGEPGATRDTSRPAVQLRNPISPEFACPLRITVQVSNFHHRFGGVVRAFPLGTADALAAQRERRVVTSAVLLGAYLLTAAISLVFFVTRRKDRVPLAFGLLSAAVAVYADIAGERLLLRLLPGEWPLEPFLKLEYLSWFAAIALFGATVRTLFPQAVSRRVQRAVALACAAAGLAVLLAPARIFSHLAPAGQLLTGAVVLYAAFALLRAARTGTPGARLPLAALVVLLVTIAIDAALYYFGAPVQRFAPYGVAVFVLSPAFVLAHRVARALGAEARTRTLEENARLREDVERMSRHDLKTPLNSVLGVARILREDARLPAGHQELVGILERAGWRMLEMVNLSLGLYRMETGGYDFRPQAVNLREVVSRVMVDLHGLAESHGVGFAQASASRLEPVYVRGEELLCYSILANLVKNAVEATPAGGVVTIELHPGDPVRLAVRNPGEVPPEVAGRFFQKYATGGKAGGTGLGAYSARLMARVQEGELAMATGAGGTTLTLTLRPLTGEPPVPARRDPAAAGAPAATVAANAEFPPRTVLVVDDDEYNRLLLRRYLPSPPFAVETEPNGQAAIDHLRRDWPDYLLIDLEMPVMNGTDAVAWARRHEAQTGLPRCTVVMLSSHDEPEVAQRCLAAGADRYLTKPVSRETLMATLRELDRARPAAASLPDAARAIVQIDPELLELVPEFLQTRHQLVRDMAQALERGDREALRWAAHKSAGGLALYGFSWGAEVSRAIENEALDGDVAALAEKLEALSAHLQAVRYV